MYFDSQSSSRILVSVGGLVTDSYSYKAFGEELQAGSGTANPFRYVGAYGYYRDVVSRYYVRARHLDVTAGRWVSRDLIGFGGGDKNNYQYSLNRINIVVDPSGLFGQGPIYFDPGNGLPGIPVIPPPRVRPDPVPDPTGNCKNAPPRQSFTCSFIMNCLSQPRARCESSNKHPEGQDPYTMMCMFRQENGGLNSGNARSFPRSGGGWECLREGPGNLTFDAFKQLVKNCNWLRTRFRSYYDFLKNATECEKAQAAFDWLGTVGFAGYGPGTGRKGNYDNSDGLLNRVKKCAVCLRDNTCL